MSWKAWFILAWLSMLTGKLIYFTRKIVDLYHVEDMYGLLPTEEEYLKHRYMAEATVTFIMIVISIIVGIWVITTFPD